MVQFNFYGEDSAPSIVHDAQFHLTDQDFILREIQRFLASSRRMDMLAGERYFLGQQDILHHKRTVIGSNGSVEVIHNLPNNRIVDNQYRKMVVQKVNYLLGKPLTIQSQNLHYQSLLKRFFDRKFMRLLKNLGRDALNGGIGWLFCYYDPQGKFCFRRFPPSQVIPGWRDEEHTVLDYAIRVYDALVFEGKQEKIVQKVEVYHASGIHRFQLEKGRLVPDEVFHEPYFTVFQDNGAVSFNWERLPLVPFRRNGEEISLIRGVKSLQDGLNQILSNFQNNMEEDARNTILVLVNYDGENLAEFRKNLAAYGAVKVKTVDGAPGDLRTLQVEVKAENYRAILEIFKKAIIENAMGYDAKDDRLSGNANQLNILSMYSDIDLDANEMETEFQASFVDLLYFMGLHFVNSGEGDFEGEQVEILFNRDMLISETDIIRNIRDSVGILSEETLVANHPWAGDLAGELERKNLEKKGKVDWIG